MSAATRRPYLGETVHLVTKGRNGARCRAAVVTDIVEGELELLLLAPPAPSILRQKPHDESEQPPIGSWHFSCTHPLGISGNLPA